MSVEGVRACRSEEHTSELQSHLNLVCRLLLETKKCMNSFPLTTNGRRRSPQLLPRVSTTRNAHTNTLHALKGPAADPRTPLFFFNDTATTEIYTLSLHDALPISHARTQTHRHTDTHTHTHTHTHT